MVGGDAAVDVTNILVCRVLIWSVVTSPVQTIPLLGTVACDYVAAFFKLVERSAEMNAYLGRSFLLCEIHVVNHSNVLGGDAVNLTA